MNIEISGLLSKVQGMNFPTSVKEQMYKLVIEGDGSLCVLKAIGGRIFKVEGETVQEIEDPFSFIVSRINNAPKFIVKQATKIMQSEAGQVSTALQKLCEGGRVATVVIAPTGKANNSEPVSVCEIRGSDGAIINKFENEQIKNFFCSMF